MPDNGLSHMNDIPCKNNRSILYFRFYNFFKVVGQRLYLSHHGRDVLVYTLLGIIESPNFYMMCLQMRQIHTKQNIIFIIVEEINKSTRHVFGTIFVHGFHSWTWSCTWRCSMDMRLVHVWLQIIYCILILIALALVCQFS